MASRIKSPALKTESVTKQAAAEKARKAASKAALKQAPAIDRRAPDAAVQAIADAVVTKLADARHEQDRINRLATAEQDAEATGQTLEQVLADMGIDAQGNVLEAEKTRYAGPMLALVAARKAYVKGSNGNPHTADELGYACAAYTRECVVQAMVAALELPGNPYTKLNPGQQSMNLRNKARHALKAGTVTMPAIQAALVAACTPHPAKA